MRGCVVRGAVIDLVCGGVFSLACTHMHTCTRAISWSSQATGSEVLSRHDYFISDRTRGWCHYVEVHLTDWLRALTPECGTHCLGIDTVPGVPGITRTRNAQTASPTSVRGPADCPPNWGTNSGCIRTLAVADGWHASPPTNSALDSTRGMHHLGGVRELAPSTGVWRTSEQSRLTAP